MAVAELGRLKMYYQIAGEGEPLILINGVSMDFSYWIMQVPELSKKYRVVVFDNRGVGRTDSPEPPYTTEMMADDLAALMDALAIESAHILGLALGGLVAQEFALKYPDRTRSLILNASASCPELEAPRSMHLGNTMLMLAKAEYSLETRIRMSIAWALTEEFFESTEQVQMVINLILAAPCPQTAQGLEGQVTAGRTHDTRDRLSRITAPTLVLVGREDLVLPVELSEKLAAGIPNAELKILESGGHLVCYEYTTKFNQAVLDFLE